MLRLIQRVRRRWLPPGAQASFSQCGEDRICAHLFSAVFHIPKPSFLDIGANDPISLNNSYLFSLAGSRGVLVEPDPDLCSRIRAARPRDTCLGVGIGSPANAGSPADVATAPFFVFAPAVLNTFVEAEAEANRRLGHRLVRTIQVPLVDVNGVVREHFPDGGPDLVSLDTEGFDEAILASWDFSRSRPPVFCVETLSYESQQKSTAIARLMADRGYVAYADTFINTIFVEGAKFAARKRA